MIEHTLSRSRPRLGRWTTVLLLAGGCVMMLLPLLVLVGTALKSDAEIQSPEPSIFPAHLHFENFVRAFSASARVDFLKCLKNTVCLTLLDIIGTTLSCSLVAYGFARFECRWNRPLFLVLLSTMMLPHVVTSIPRFLLFVKFFGWYDTLYPLWIGSFFGNAFFIFLLYEFFRGIPTSLLEAARLDGCNEFEILYHVVLPLSKPALIVIALFTFMGAWNDFLGPLIYLEDPDKFTLALGLREFLRDSTSGEFGTQWNLLMAASLLVMAPVIALFFCAQKYFVEGIALSGTKQ